MLLQEHYFLLHNGILMQISVCNYPKFNAFSHKCRSHMMFDIMNIIFMNIFKIFFTLQIFFTVWNLNALFSVSMFKRFKNADNVIFHYFLRSRNSFLGTNREPLISFSMVFLFWPNLFSLMVCTEIMPISRDCILISSR